MKIILTKKEITHCTELSCYDNNVYKLPYKISNSLYIKEVFYECENIYEYLFGTIKDNKFIEETAFHGKYNLLTREITIYME